MFSYKYDMVTIAHLPLLKSHRGLSGAMYIPGEDLNMIQEDSENTKGHQGRIMIMMIKIMMMLSVIMIMNRQARKGIVLRKKQRLALQRSLS